MNKDFYEHTELEIIKFSTEDVITPSGNELPFVPDNH